MYKYANLFSWKIILLFLGLVFFGLSINYFFSLQTQAKEEYQRLTTEVTRATKLLSVINYMFADDFSKSDDRKMPSTDRYTRQFVQGRECYWQPAKQSLPSSNQSSDKTALKLDYAIKGTSESCDPNSVAYQDINDKASVVSMFSFLIDVNKYVMGLYFTSINHYMAASPAASLTNMHAENMDLLGSKTYFWTSAAKDMNAINISGPYQDVATGKTILSSTSSVYNGKKFEGVVTLDLDISKFHEKDSNIRDNPVNKFIYFGRKDDDYNNRNDVLFVTDLHIDGVSTKQVMYFKWNWSEQIKRFFAVNIQALIIITIAFTLLGIGRININVRTENKKYRNLAYKDSLTSLLNRRGFELEYNSNQIQSSYEGLAIFDIDDFKKVNDLYGHNVGDDAICQVAETLHQYTQISDLVARFGGEEFVVYMKRDDMDSIVEDIQKIQQSVAAESIKVISGEGFTISTGLTIQLTDDNISLEEMLKLADVNLYKAKSSGKNKVIYG